MEEKKIMVQVDHVGMRFKMTQDRVFSLKEFMMQAATRKLKFNEFWALKDISFTIEKGDVLGIIGRNGAGKSTILKIISGIMKPTQGTVTRGGNIVPMLELGSGFDYDLTGRENVFLNGSILGYSKEFLYSKYDEILSVGDEAFQRKSHARMMELMGGGTTVLFVSHSLDQIRQMCNKVVWIDQGYVKMAGPTQEVCDAYKL